MATPQAAHVSDGLARWLPNFLSTVQVSFLYRPTLVVAISKAIEKIWKVKGCERKEIGLFRSDINQGVSYDSR